MHDHNLPQDDEASSSAGAGDGTAIISSQNTSPERCEELKSCSANN